MFDKHNFKIEDLTAQNVLKAHNFLQLYLEESDLVKHLTYCPNTTHGTLAYIAQSDDCEGILISYKDIVVGFAAFGIHHSWWQEAEAYIEMFFVHPEARATGASRMLVDACISKLQAYDVKVVTTSCESGMGDLNDKLYTNLFLKRGFHKLGSAVRRFL